MPLFRIVLDRLCAEPIRAKFYLSTVCFNLLSWQLGTATYHLVDLVLILDLNFEYEL